MSDQTFTVGELKRRLQGIPDDDILEFDGGLTFNRIKRRGDDLVVLEFAEPQAYLDEDFRKRNPHVQVAFVSDSGPEDGEPVWSVDVGIQ
ncbi:hypothetical protein C6A77_05665 [Pseudomonas sp. AFG_SD02_1510_Pfu_092]|uniref:hypothetical protein n=1 Tax=Pseudomonas sp. AFG_SD02_1510_Pfu_092 TaxID=2259497 RepID=UPI000DEFA94D|nr:hypothetical protein [Pseudomonas sp. AFG_SD02_1510_Pfu_092]RCL28581.1 hypothetical protein C6A77_05665 [Pseudomonas sp. AFG_SD02_1510_Pfu_092]